MHLQHVMRILLLITITASLSLLVGCATNKIALSSYTEPAEINRLKHSTSIYSIGTIQGLEDCSIYCTENSPIVWHSLANSFEYPPQTEFFKKIPIKNLEKFIRNSIITTNSSNKDNTVNIYVNRILLKTWPRPTHTACLVDITLRKGNEKYRGKGIVKTNETFQIVHEKPPGVFYTEFIQNGSYIVRLATRKAFNDALSKISKETTH